MIIILRENIRSLTFFLTWTYNVRYRAQDVLLVDDIQFLEGKKTSLSEMSFTIDALLGEGSQIIISSDKPPKKLDVDEHMRSKLGMGLIAELKAPDTLMKNSLRF